MLERIRPVDILALTLADAPIPAEDVAWRLESERRAPRRAPEGVRQHAASVAQREDGIVPEHRRQMTHLHPPFRFPPHEFDLFGVEVSTARHGGCAVVLLQSRIRDQPALLELACHWRARIRRWMLD